MQRHSQRLSAQSTAAVAIRLAAGSVSQLIWENNNKSRNPLAAKRTKIKALKRLEVTKQFGNFQFVRFNSNYGGVLNGTPSFPVKDPMGGILVSQLS